MKKLFLLSFLCLVFSFNVVLAQDDALPVATGESTVESNNDVLLASLDIKEPRVLPDSIWYGFKRFWEGTKNVFTFDPVKKTERKLEQANLRIMEAKLLAEKVGKEEILEKALEKYEATMANIQTRVAKFEEKKTEATERFRTKLVNMQIQQGKVLDKIEELQPSQQERVRAVKTNIISRLGEVIDSMDDEAVNEELQRVLEDNPIILERVIETQPRVQERVQNIIQNNTAVQNRNEGSRQTPPATGEPNKKGQNK